VFLIHLVLNGFWKACNLFQNTKCHPIEELTHDVNVTISHARVHNTPKSKAEYRVQEYNSRENFQPACNQKSEQQCRRCHTCWPTFQIRGNADSRDRRFTRAQMWGTEIGQATTPGYVIHEHVDITALISETGTVNEMVTCCRSPPPRLQSIRADHCLVGETSDQSVGCVFDFGHRYLLDRGSRFLKPWKRHGFMFLHDSHPPCADHRPLADLSIFTCCM
jgi:hypothetical protein